MPDDSAGYCQHPQIWFSKGDYYVTCPACLARWGRLGKDGRREYAVINGEKIGCAPEEANNGFTSDGTSRHL